MQEQALTTADHYTQGFRVVLHIRQENSRLVETKIHDEVSSLRFSEDPIEAE
jgi:hypothetical protein